MRRLITLVGLIAFVAAACGGTSPSPSPSAATITTHVTFDGQECKYDGPTSLTGRSSCSSSKTPPSGCGSTAKGAVTIGADLVVIETTPGTTWDKVEASLAAGTQGTPHPGVGGGNPHAYGIGPGATVMTTATGAAYDIACHEYWDKAWGTTYAAYPATLIEVEGAYGPAPCLGLHSAPRYRPPAPHCAPGRQDAHRASGAVPSGPRVTGQDPGASTRAAGSSHTWPTPGRRDRTARRFPHSSEAAPACPPGYAGGRLLRPHKEPLADVGTASLAVGSFLCGFVIGASGRLWSGSASPFPPPVRRRVGSVLLGAILAGAIATLVVIIGLATGHRPDPRRRGHRRPAPRSSSASSSAAPTARRRARRPRRRPRYPDAGDPDAVVPGFLEAHADVIDLYARSALRRTRTTGLAPTVPSALVPIRTGFHAVSDVTAMDVAQMDVHDLSRSPAQEPVPHRPRERWSPILASCSSARWPVRDDRPCCSGPGSCRRRGRMRGTVAFDALLQIPRRPAFRVPSPVSSPRTRRACSHP